MINLDQKEQKIIEVFLKGKKLQSSDVYEYLTKQGEKIALVTVKRHLSDLSEKGVLEVKGSGRSTFYLLTTKGRVFSDIDPNEYVSVEPDKRYGMRIFNFELFNKFPQKLFSEEEISKLKKLTEKYHQRSKEITETVQKKELERLIIELSWKSSKIEGNTYTLLDTEKLIKENKPAEGKTKEETQMILNHKQAFDFIFNNKEVFKHLNKDNLIKLHEILVEKLNINTNFRKNLVGIAGSKYQPLDNVYQIEEAVDSLSKAITQMDSPFSKALTALAGVSYIQPFEDGNKRTSRLIANAVLLAYDCMPLSYRNIDEKRYKSAALVFYELNSIIPLKEIFINQYEFAVENYNI